LPAHKEIPLYFEITFRDFCDARGRIGLSSGEGVATNNLAKFDAGSQIFQKINPHTKFWCGGKKKATLSGRKKATFRSPQAKKFSL